MFYRIPLSTSFGDL